MSTEQVDAQTAPVQPTKAVLFGALRINVNVLRRTDGLAFLRDVLTRNDPFRSAESRGLPLATRKVNTLVLTHYLQVVNSSAAQIAQRTHVYMRTGARRSPEGRDSHARIPFDVRARHSHHVFG